MSSDEDNDLLLSKPRRARDSKKRRVARACDICRRRKVRCDGEQVPGRKCANCQAANLECSYIQAMKKYPEGYVEALESKLEKVEGLLQRLHPTEDFTHEIGVALTRENWMQAGVLGDAEAVSRVRSGGFESVEASSEDEDTGLKLQELTNHLHIMHIGVFRGKSSTAAWIEAALALKRESKSNEQPVPESLRRSFFWAMLPFEKELLEAKSSSYTFPEPDLFWHLVDCYFKHINVILPTLHRPTFEKCVHDGLHIRDESFAGVVLLVCAIGARICSDRRVLLKDYDDGTWMSAGWAYFSQVQMTQKALISTSRLYDLQIYCLATTYLLGNSITQRGWNLCGIGIRLALDIGAHKKKVYGEMRTAEDELFKRAFWVLVWLDRWMSAIQGRLTAIQDDDIDVDLPAACDDEYWDHPDPLKRFQQPADRPSYMAYFIESAKQNQILGSALDTIYASHKKRIHRKAIGPDWEMRTIASFDSRMNEWADALPSHLRWNATQQNELFFTQSTHLHSQFYYLQILVHRPFVSTRKEPQLAFRSLAVCINAARSCARVLDTLRRRTQIINSPYVMIPALASGVMLLLGIWNIKRTGIQMSQERETEAVQKCLLVLEEMEVRWVSGGRIRDVLADLARHDEPCKPGPPPVSHKRAREPEVTEPAGTLSDHSSPDASSNNAYPASPATGYSSATAFSASPLMEHNGKTNTTVEPAVQVTPDITHTITDAPDSNTYAPAPEPIVIYPEATEFHLPIQSNELQYVPENDPLWAISGTPFEASFATEHAVPPGVWQSMFSGGTAPMYGYAPYGDVAYGAYGEYQADAQYGMHSAHTGYEHMGQDNGSAYTSVADWRRKVAPESGSLANAIPPEHLWQPAQTHSGQQYIHSTWHGRAANHSHPNT